MANRCFLILLAAINVSHLFANEYHCLDENARKTITFANNPSEAVPDLPNVRIMQGGYPSQFAIHYIAYMFMQDYLGMNVSMYPTEDPDLGWTYLADNPTNDSLDKGYPENFFAWLARDLNDLLFEIWNIQIEGGKGNEYFLSGEVDSGGFVGAFAEISIWLPQYFVEQYPTATIPWVLQNDNDVRAQLIHGPTNGTGVNYIELYGTNESRVTSPFYFDIADMTRPTVWMSLPGFVMTEHAWNITHNMFGGVGLNVSLVSVKNEANILEMIQDLYTRRMPFIANIYTVDEVFSSVDDESDELYKFEKITLYRNPDQSIYDECWVAKECQWPIDLLAKAANPLLEQRFPEAWQFYSGFTISTTQVNKMLDYYSELKSDGNFTTEEKWKEAACMWLSDPDTESTWNSSSWMVDVVRYDCVSGCGVDGYGGSCDYLTGECVCDHDELFAEFDCSRSCDGLLGPYFDNSDNDDYYFEFCSGYGTCDTFSKTCSCDLGYGGDGCETKYSQFKYPLSFQLVTIIISTLIVLAGGSCIFWLRLNKEYKTVRALSVNLTTIMTAGFIILVSSNIVLVIEVTDATCVIWQWLFGLGTILSIMSPLLKAYRVGRLFGSASKFSKVIITDGMLMKTLAKAAVFEILLCIAYTISHQVNGGVSDSYNHSDLRIETQCNQHAMTSYFNIGSYTYFFLSLCTLAYYSHGARRAFKIFAERRCAYFSSFMALFCTLLTFVFELATDDPTFRVAVRAYAIIIVVTAVMGIYYGPRMYHFFTHPAERNETDIETEQSSRQQKAKKRKDRTTSEHTLSGDEQMPSTMQPSTTGTLQLTTQ